MRRAALALFVLAPWAAECSWGGFTAVDFPFVVLFLAPMYGGAALLIREAARRTGGGWPMIVLLAAAYGVFQVSFVDQALFNVDFLDDTQFAANAVGARRTWVPGLEFSVAQLLSYVGNHVVLTVCVPIAIVETFVSPERRHRPWLRWPGLLVTAILFVLGCWIVFADTSKGFVASPLQRAVAAGVVVALAVAAVRLPPRSPGRSVKASGAVGDGISALSRGDRALATRLRVAAGDIADDEIISEATRAAVGRQVGADIEIDPALGTEIQVHYTPGPRGEIVFGGIRCGATANVLEILAHAEVVRLLRRYEGLTGQVRRLWDAMLSLGGPNPARPFPPGSMAFESWLEMQKLPEILEIRRAALGQAIGRDGEELLRRDVEFLEAEYRRHAEVVDQMIIERGANFVARAEERTAEAVAAGMPALDGHPLIADASKYYYRSNPGGSPPYVLCRISTESTPARTLVPDGGGWRIAEGALSRGEQATAMVAGWPAHAQTAFDAVKAAHAGQRVVPLQGLATVGKTIGDLPPPGLFDRLRVILVEAYTRAGDPDALGKATEAARAVVEHKIVVVRGTDQLRAFNYRLNFTGSADEIASTDLHHIIPLQLGGDHRRLVAVQRDLHDRLHDLIDELQLGDGTLAPNSIRSSGDLIFAEGAAVLRADGSVQLARLNPDGTYTLVP
ncbi:hypothetical protein GCM10009558_036980 [Virgisporangium aurantiacum]